MLGELCRDVQLRYIQMRATNVRINMRTILGAIGINVFIVPASPAPPLVLLLLAAVVALARRDQLLIF